MMMVLQCPLLNFAFAEPEKETAGRPTDTKLLQSAYNNNTLPVFPVFLNRCLIWVIACCHDRYFIKIIYDSCNYCGILWIYRQHATLKNVVEKKIFYQLTLVHKVVC